MQLGQRKLEMELETTELFDLHDHYAVRLVGIPMDVDPDLVKFYLSGLSMNLVKDVVYQSDGPRAVAYFQKPIGNSLTLNSCNESS